MNAFQLPLTRPLRTIPVDMCPRLMVLTTLISPSNFSLALSKLIIPTLSQPKLCTIKAYGSTANPASPHLASPPHVSQWRSVARWKTQRGRPLALSSVRKEWSRLRSRCLWIMPQIRMFGREWCVQYATSSLPSRTFPISSKGICPSNCLLELRNMVKDVEYGQIAQGRGIWSNSFFTTVTSLLPSRTFPISSKGIYPSSNCLLELWNMVKDVEYDQIAGIWSNISRTWNIVK